MLSFSYTPYIAVIGDIKNSKQIKNRNTFQSNFKALLDAINKEYKADIASDFMITLGDEFQGLLTNGRPVPYIIDRIERELYPESFRFGIGVGEITTDIQQSVPLGADGPAYHLAREMINTVKQSESKKGEPLQNTAISIQGYADITALLNTIFILLSELHKSRTEKHLKIINLYLQEGYTQKKIADELDIKTQSSVQRSLAAASYYANRNALVTIADILSEIKEDDCV